MQTVISEFSKNSLVVITQIKKRTTKQICYAEFYRKT